MSSVIVMLGTLSAFFLLFCGLCYNEGYRKGRRDGFNQGSYFIKWCDRNE